MCSPPGWNRVLLHLFHRVQQGMETLPVLSATNRTEHAEWHAYFERVYGEPVTSPVDLNTFTWFYHWAPRHPGRVVGRYTRVGEVPVDGPWMFVRHTGFDIHTALNYHNPETALSRQGFFVNRRLDNVSLTTGSRVEILRVSDYEVEQRWFYIVRGSGIYIDLPCTVTRQPKPNVNDDRLMDGIQHGAIFEWFDSRLELVLRGYGGSGISSPCVDGLRYSSGWSRPIPLNCHNPPGVSMKLCVTMAAVCILMMLSKLRVMSVAARLVVGVLSIAALSAAAVTLCRTRRREATFTIG
jgi:hypothetical protein